MADKVVEKEKRCEGCGLTESRCVCSAIPHLKPKTRLLVLQHPQEPRVPVSTGQLTTKTFERSAIKVGLSWANLQKALGEEVDPKRWGVLYLGSVHPHELPGESPLFEVDRQGKPLSDKVPRGLDGFVVLDGTWSQAKTLWWRNAWLLKLRRIILRPKTPALYHKIRKEPRKECLSTIESAGAVLDALDGSDKFLPAAQESLGLFMKALPKPDNRHRSRGRRRR